MIERQKHMQLTLSVGAVRVDRCGDNIGVLLQDLSKCRQLHIMAVDLNCGIPSSQQLDCFGAGFEQIVLQFYLKICLTMVQFPALLNLLQMQ